MRLVGPRPFGEDTVFDLEADLSRRTALIASSLPFVVVAGLLGAAGGDGSAVELRYHGSFAKASRDGDQATDAAKRFDLYCLVTPHSDGGRDVAFVVDEHGGGSWPWPARFGTLAVDSKNHANKHPIRLLYEYNGTEYAFHVPFPYFEFADRLAADARWEASRESDFANQRDSAPWKYHSSLARKIGTRDCWRVDVTNNFGPQESLWIEKGTPLVVKAERRIVIGRGEVHLLKMELESVTPVGDEPLRRIRRPLDRLLRLQEELKRAEDEKSAELSEAQLKAAGAALKTLEQEADGTPFDRFVASIVRDVNTQSRRSGDVGSLAKRFVGKSAPPLALKSLDNETIDPAERAGKIVLLHFWSYQGEPFPPEPYGQVGFLDYLHNRRKKVGLKVYGVAVDRRLSDKSLAPAVVRSVRKLQGFMNLSYPLALDDGSLIEKFGDPERVGAKLPLWVLIDPEGNVVEYKVGHFDIKSDEGLVQLDKAIIALVKKQRTTKQQ